MVSTIKTIINYPTNARSFELYLLV